MTDKETEHKILDQQKMATEMQRVRTLLQAATEACANEGGDIRFFNAAFLVAAIQLQAEVEGVETVARALTKLGVQHLKQSGAVALC